MLLTNRQSGKIVFKTFSLLLLILLNGCNQEDTPTNSWPDSNGDDYVTVDAIDSYIVKSMSNQADFLIDLSNKINASEFDQVILSKVTPLSDKGRCEVSYVSDKTFGLSADGVGVCDLQFNVQSKDGTKILVGKKSGLVRVVVAKDSSETQLVPFGVAAYSGESKTIDLKANLEIVGEPTDISDLNLDNNVVIVPVGSTSTIVVDAKENKFVYTPSVGFEGSERILYSLSDVTGERIYTGEIIVSVSNETNVGIDVESKVKIDNAKINERIEVNMADYIVTSEDDDFQLLYVSTFNASVALHDETDLKNKTFDFIADTAGVYHVNAVLTDHRGGFDVSLVEISVKDPNASAVWGNLVDDDEVYIAPLTVSEAESEGVSIAGGYIEYDYPSPVNVATYLNQHALNFCASRGKLPTTSQLKSIASRYQMHNVLSWPVSRGYITSDGDLINLADGSEIAGDGQAFYATCVADGSFTLKVTDETAIANGVDVAALDAEILLNGSPVSGASLSVSTSSSTAVIDVPNPITNESGIAHIAIRDDNAESVIVTVDFMDKSQSAVVIFGGDPATAVINGITTPINDVGYGDVALAKVTVVDYNDNPVPKVDVTITTDESLVSLAPGSVVETDADGVADVYVNWKGGELDTDTAITIDAEHTSSVGGPSFASAVIRFIGGILSDFFRDSDISSNYATLTAKVTNKSGAPLSGRDVIFRIKSSLLDGQLSFGGGDVVNCATVGYLCRQFKTNGDGLASAVVKLADDYMEKYTETVTAKFGGQRKTLEITLRDILTIESDNYIFVIKPDAKFMDDGRFVSTPGDGIPWGVQDDVLRFYTEANSTLPTYGQMNSLPQYMSVDHWNPLLCEMLDFDYNGYTDWKAVPNHYIDELKEKLNTVDSSDFPEELVVINANSSRTFKSANKANAYQTPIELTPGTIGGQSIICYTPK